MKNILIILGSILINCSINRAISQILKKTDSIYFLIDTTKVPFNDRMWEIDYEGKFKYYTFKCPCLKYNSQPTFIRNKDAIPSIINKRELALLNKMVITDLIRKISKNMDSNLKSNDDLFLIEPIGKKYEIFKVSVIPPIAPRVTN